MSFEVYKDLLKPTSKNFDEVNSGKYEYEESTGQNYRCTMADNDVMLIEFEASKSDKAAGPDTKLSIDWHQNLDFFPKKTYMYDTPYSVHGGFYQNWISVRNKILDFFYAHNPKYIAIRGFSQGASVGVLCYQDIDWHIRRDFEGQDKRVSATLYEPAKVYYGKAPYLSGITIIINRNDPVCMIPPFASHVGNIIKIGKWYRFKPIQHEPKAVMKSLDEYNRLTESDRYLQSL